jgi:hypothetical protein
MKKLLLLICIILIGVTANAQENEAFAERDHFISLEEAKKMTALYRQKKETTLNKEHQGKNIYPINETFNSAQILKILRKPNVKGLRIYYGMSDDLRVHAIIVGVDANGQDILDGEESIIERGIVCPPLCPNNSSPLLGALELQ